MRIAVTQEAIDKAAEELEVGHPLQPWQVEAIKAIRAQEAAKGDAAVKQANSILASRDRLRELIDKLAPEDTKHLVRTVTDKDLRLYQGIAKQAQDAGTISADEQGTLYRGLGGEEPSVEAWLKLSLPARLAVLQAVGDIACSLNLDMHPGGYAKVKTRRAKNAQQ